MKKGIMGRDEMQSPSVSLARLRNDAEDPYQNLANAIVCVAADDYRTALEKGDTSLMLSLQRFFRSAWCGTLTGIDTESLMESLNEEYKARLLKALWSCAHKRREVYP